MKRVKGGFSVALLALASLASPAYAQPDSAEAPEAPTETTLPRAADSDVAARRHAETTALPSPLAGSDAVAHRRRAERMEATLVTLSEESETSGWATFAYLLVGSGLVATAALPAFGDETDVGTGSSRLIATMGLLWMATPYLVIGVRGLVGVTTTDEERLVRYRRERRQGSLSDVTLARYEGELQAEAAVSKQLRALRGSMGIGVAAAGATLIGFTATSDLRHEDAAAFGYIMGGVFIVAGTWDTIAAFTGETATEREWRVYRNAEATASRPRVGVAIMPAREGGLGLGVVGQF